MIEVKDEKIKTYKITEVEMEFLEWVHPMWGVLPVNVGDDKRPLILKAKIKELVNE